MRGQIMVDEDGSRWIIVEEANIYFNATKNGAGTWVVAAFRSDGYRQVQGGLVEMMQYLRQTHLFTSFLEVPQHVVEYAAASWHRRHEKVASLTNVIEEKPVRTQNPEKGFHETLRFEFSEEKIGAKIAQLIENAGGQQ